MTTRIRIIDNMVGESSQYLPESVLEISDTEATRLMASGHAIPEGPAPSGVISTLYQAAGWTILSTPPTEQTVLPSGSKGGIYMRDGYHATMLHQLPRGIFIDGEYVPLPGKTNVLSYVNFMDIELNR